MNNYEKVEDFNNVGIIVKNSIPKIIINEDGIQGKIINNYYNILLNNEELVSQVWFDRYKIDEEGNCKIGIKRTSDDYKRLLRFSNYVDSNNHLLEKYLYAYGLINKLGILVIDPLYERIKYANEDSYIVFYNTKQGYVSCKQKIQITPIIFDNAKKFHDGLASVTYNNKSGYISRNHIMNNPDDDMEYAIAPNYDYANDFINGVAEVGYYGSKMYINNKNCQVRVRSK